MNTSPSTRTLRGHQRMTVALLFLAGMVNFFDRASLSVANVTISSEMHLSATQMGWLLSGFSLAYGFAQLPLVGMLDCLGTRSVLAAGLGLWSTAQMLTALVRGFPLFMVFRFLLGAGEAPFYPAAVRSVREWFGPQTRGRATALVSSSQTFGLALAPPVLALLVLRIGWRPMFALLGVAGLVLALAWYALHRPRAETIFREPGEGASVHSAWSALLREPTVWGMMLGFGGINYTNWLYTAWLPGYLQLQRHLSLAKTGWVASIPFLAGAAGMLSSGYLADHFAARGMRLTTVHRVQILAGMLVSAASTYEVARSGSTVAAVAGISGALFCIHFAGTSAWGYAQAIGGATRVASLSALQNFGSFLIASAAPVLTGFLLDRTGSFAIALGTCSAVTVLGALSYATLARPSRNSLLAAP